MKNFIAALIASVALMGIGCRSVETAKVDPTTIATETEAVAIVQCSAFGLAFLLNFVPIVDASLDTVVNKMMVAEAKALGGNRVQLITAFEAPNHSLASRIVSLVYSVPVAVASGIVVK